MAQTGYTPILLYSSSTGGNTPSAGNLTNSTLGSELAINIADKNLFFKDSSNVVNTVPIRQSSGSSNGWLSSTDWTTFNNKQPAGTYVTSVSGTAPVVSSGGTTPTISMAAATSSVNGYLTSTDWSTFNGKQAALVSGTNIKTVNSTSLLGSGDVSVGVLTVTGTAPVVSSGGANPAISIAVANGTTNGYLSSTDWTTFNNKQATLVSGTNIKTVSGVSLLGSGDVGTIGTGYGGTGLTSFTANGIVYASSTSALATSSNFTFNGSTLTTNNVNGLFSSGSSATPGIITQGASTSQGQIAFGSAVTTYNIQSGADYAGMNFNIATGTYKWFSGATQEMTLFPSGGLSLGNTTDPGAGNLRFATTGSNGIYFGSSSQLNDYETGTWTPILGADGGQSGQTYGAQTGYYTKIGNVVVATAIIRLTAVGTLTGTYAVIAGLPFASANGSGNQSNGNVLFGYAASFASNINTIGGYVPSTATLAYLTGSSTTGTAPYDLLGKAILGNSTFVSVTITYKTA